MTATTSASPRHFEGFHRAHRRLTDHHESSEANVGIPFHGSCSRCHHFHINYPFTFSLDSSVHTTLFCERCNHPMFGLGRASTQNTLASVESGSTFTPRACVDRAGQQQDLPVETAPASSGLGQLTTITERRSPAPSRSNSNIRTPTPTLAAASTPGVDTRADNRRREHPESRVLPKDSAQESIEERAQHPQTVSLKRLQMFGRQFKRRIYAKPREWKLPRIGLHINYARRAGMAGHTSASASTTVVSSAQGQSRNAEELENGTGDDTKDTHASLRAKRRREMTIAREGDIALISRCECGPECLCNSGSQVAQVDRAETPENIHVPDYLFRHPHMSTGSTSSQPSQYGTQELDLLHIGGHFDSPRRSSSADESSSVAESGPRRVRLSQGSTLWSNGSSISLRARRPLVSRASSMPVATRRRNSAGARNGSQTDSLIPGSGCPETARASSSLGEGNMPGRKNHTRPSQNSEFSTNHADDPSSEEQEQRVDGDGPANHTPKRDVDEVTPTPRSGIHMDVDLGTTPPIDSDGLSSALQDLENRETIDHEIHSL